MYHEVDLVTVSAVNCIMVIAHCQRFTAASTVSHYCLESSGETGRQARLFHCVAPKGEPHGEISLDGKRREREVSRIFHILFRMMGACCVLVNPISAFGERLWGFMAKFKSLHMLPR